MNEQIQQWEPMKLVGAIDLPARTIDCWLLNLDRLPEVIAALRDDEIQRANRFRFARDRRRFIAARNAIRTILAGYEGTKPAEIVFHENEFGRPEIHPSKAGITFNHSRSGERGLLCVAEDGVLGIDIEELRDARDLVDVAKLNFSRRELIQLEQLPEGAQLEAFYNCWTRKEAVVKAAGQGLSAPLADFDVVLAPGREPAILGGRNELERIMRWRLRSFTPAENFIAAIATGNSSPDYRHFRWIP
ncbi:MAG: 4'-phosphopantetheinyl transferase superfamily protein [Marinicaulis sp.]|nr:4'-phosphopantetheinyl transferase superfamily protein [Marinicaulis sp.]